MISCVASEFCHFSTFCHQKSSELSARLMEVSYLECDCFFFQHCPSTPPTLAREYWALVRKHSTTLSSFLSYLSFLFTQGHLAVSFYFCQSKVSRIHASPDSFYCFSSVLVKCGRVTKAQLSCCQPLCSYWVSAWINPIYLKDTHLFLLSE